MHYQLYDYNGNIGQRECKVEGPFVWGTQKEVIFELSLKGELDLLRQRGGVEKSSWQVQATKGGVVEEEARGVSRD